LKNEGDIKGTWKIINSSVKKQIKFKKITISDNEGNVNLADIPDKFNNYFANIANELVSSLPQADTEASSYLKDRILNSFFSAPIVKKELENSISQLKVNKGIHTISTSILSDIKSEISESLSYIFN